MGMDKNTLIFFNFSGSFSGFHLSPPTIPNPKTFNNFLLLSDSSPSFLLFLRNQFNNNKTQNSGKSTTKTQNLVSFLLHQQVQILRIKNA